MSTMGVSNGTSKEKCFANGDSPPQAPIFSSWATGLKMVVFQQGGSNLAKNAKNGQKKVLFELCREDH